MLLDSELFMFHNHDVHASRPAHAGVHNATGRDRELPATSLTLNHEPCYRAPSPTPATADADIPDHILTLRTNPRATHYKDQQPAASPRSRALTRDPADGSRGLADHQAHSPDLSRWHAQHRALKPQARPPPFLAGAPRLNGHVVPATLLLPSSPSPSSYYLYYDSRRNVASLIPRTPYFVSNVLTSRPSHSGRVLRPSTSTNDLLAQR
ncbi:hypothetical protein C8Q78DRAFT_255068 [Trametes maxima]|nr:hypothetical protein C8Q78DRAFT_255068 [Trametes maxima]